MAATGLPERVPDGRRANLMRDRDLTRARSTQHTRDHQDDNCGLRGKGSAGRSMWGGWRAWRGVIVTRFGRRRRTRGSPPCVADYDPPALRGVVLFRAAPRVWPPACAFDPLASFFRRASAAPPP